jgi:membrane protease YdiL (CAAX protease family)
MGVAMLCLGAVVAAAMIAINTQPLNSAPTILSFCVYMFTVGMAEETLCRGVMAESLLEHFGTGRAGIWKAILISSLMFGLTHFVNLVNGASLAGTVSQALDAFTIGLVFSVIYFRSGNLWVTILLHAIWDFSTMLMVEDGLFVTSTTLSDKISDMSDAGHISLFVPVSFAALAVFLLHSPKQYAQVGKWFDPYCAKNIKEEK